jgi:hypothetical protein
VPPARPQAARPAASAPAQRPQPFPRGPGANKNVAPKPLAARPGLKPPVAPRPHQPARDARVLQRHAPAGPPAPPRQAMRPRGAQAPPPAPRTAVNYPAPRRPFVIQAKSNTIQLHHTVPLTDTTVDDAIIYLVFEKANPGPKGANEDKKNDIVRYVGQTCAQQGVNTRFANHLNNPNHSNWSHNTHWICPEFEAKMTKLETTAMEQYFIEAYYGSLENGQNSLTKAKFNQYATPQTFRPSLAKLLKKNWEPHQ